MDFYILGNPVAQGRPKFFRRGDIVGAYDPAKSRSWKETVKWQVIAQGSEILEGALSLSLLFFLQRPKSLHKKVVHHIKRPDLDNLVKGVKDALKGICYRDDSQIVRLEAEKNYGDKPGVHVVIEKIEEYGKR